MNDRFNNYMRNFTRCISIFSRIRSFTFIMLIVITLYSIFFLNNEIFAQITSFESSNDTTDFQDKYNTTNKATQYSFEAANEAIPTNTTKAIEYYDKGISIDPDWATLYLNKAYAFYKQGDLKNALEQIEKSISLDPDWAVPWMDKGNIFFKQNNFTNAISFYEKAISLDPKWPAPYINKAITLSTLGNFSGATEFYDLALNHLGDLDAQIKSLNKNNPSSLPYWINIWFDKGEALYKLEQYNKALDIYDRLITLDPNWANPWNSKGWTLFKMGMNQEAIDAFDQATKLDGTWAKPWNSKGWIQYKLGKFDDAIFSFDKAIALEPKWDKPWFNKGKVYYDLGKFEEAKEFLQHAQSLNPKESKSNQLIELINKKTTSMTP